MNRRCFRDRGVALVVTMVLAMPAVLAAGQRQPPIEIVDVTGADTMGPAAAPATLVVFADVGDAAAGGLGVILHGLAERFPTTLKVCFRHVPGADRPDALAHLAALAAGEQGRFWQMLDLLLSNQARQQHDELVAMAAQLGLDVTRFTNDLESPAARQRILSDQQQAAELRALTGPTFFVNGVRLAGRSTLVELAAQIDLAIASRR